MSKYEQLWVASSPISYLCIVTYDAKVRDLRPVIPWLKNRYQIIKPLKIKHASHLEGIPSKACKRAYKHQSKENLWKSMSNCEQVWATVSCLLTDFVSLHCDSERAYKHQSKENLWKSMSNCEQVWATVSCLLTDFVSLHCDSEILSGSNKQAIVRLPHSKLSPCCPIPHNHVKDRFEVIW